MAINPIQVQEKKKKGGGMFGQLLGGVAGGIAGAAIGGPAGASAGFGIGSQLGGAAGEAVKPTKVTGGNTRGLSRMGNDPEVQLAQLADSRKALMTATDIPEPQKLELDQQTFQPAIGALRKRLGR